MNTHSNFLIAALLVSVSIPIDSHANAGQVSEKIAAEAQTGQGAPSGYLSKVAPERVVTVVPGKTKSILVKRLETVRIVDGPRSVNWTFDTLGLPRIPLTEILPAATKVIIYVEENEMYAN